jgi:hypothetical protein
MTCLLEVGMRLIDRVHQSLDDIGYLPASTGEPGFYLDEPQRGVVRLQWGYEHAGTLVPLHEPDDWVNMCADYLRSDGFHILASVLAEGTCAAVLIDDAPGGR